MIKYILIVSLVVNLDAIIFKADVKRTDCDTSAECLSLGQSIIASKIYSKVSSKSEVIKVANNESYTKSFYQNIQVSSDDIPLIGVKENKYESDNSYISYELDSSISGVCYKNKAVVLIKDIDNLIDKLTNEINTQNNYVEKKYLYQKILSKYKMYELHKLIADLMKLSILNKPKKEYRDILYKYKELEKDFRRKRPYKNDGLIYFKEATD